MGCKQQLLTIRNQLNLDAFRVFRAFTCMECEKTHKIVKGLQGNKLSLLNHLFSQTLQRIS